MAYPRCKLSCFVEVEKKIISEKLSDYIIRFLINIGQLS